MPTRSKNNLFNALLRSRVLGPGCRLAQRSTALARPRQGGDKVRLRVSQSSRLASLSGRSEWWYCWMLGVFLSNGPMLPEFEKLKQQQRQRGLVVVSLLCRWLLVLSLFVFATEICFSQPCLRIPSLLAIYSKLCDPSLLIASK
ncbi:unnamed protein product [Polarella glacialis]|uniref:Uncharacterized protein n=1 Tax=Polarella glacialis TaxID=89957 RepID=A0A813F5N7_POLGL|nr:unnamed protein product [Polarella glacialis]